MMASETLTMLTNMFIKIMRVSDQTTGVTSVSNLIPRAIFKKSSFFPFSYSEKLPSGRVCSVKSWS